MAEPINRFSAAAAEAGTRSGGGSRNFAFSGNAPHPPPPPPPQGGGAGPGGPGGARGGPYAHAPMEQPPSASHPLTIDIMLVMFVPSEMREAALAAVKTQKPALRVRIMMPPVRFVSRRPPQ
jgi:hypothetical protein